MSIKVRFMASTKNLVDKEEVDLPIDAPSEPTVRGVLMAIAETENRDLSGLFQSGGSGSWGLVRVVRNGVVLQSLDVQVADGDVLMLLPLVGAG